MVTGSNNEAAKLVGVGSHSQWSNSLSHTGQTQTPILLSGSTAPVYAVKNWKIARDNYTIQATITVLTITHNISAIIELKVDIISINK